jgi:hypothetical protein
MKYTDDLELGDLQLHILNMYDQLDPKQIDSWPVDGLEIYAEGKRYLLRVEAAE